MTKHGLESAFVAVQKLAADFRANYSYFASSAYSEAQVRKDFIDKFFIALGWDVNHEEQSNPFEQEVKVERVVAMGAAQRRADYAFHVAPNFRDARLLVEAKKPSGAIATADNYFQTVRYGWNKQNPLAGLTDFEHFHLLDCRFKPDIDTAVHRSVKQYSLEDYADRERFAELYWLVSREAVANSSLEKFADTLPKPRRGAKQRGLFAGAYKSIDESFLEDLDGYRKTLASAFKGHNPDLDSETLTEVTQRTLDRLVFMRFLEDKLIEPSHFVATFGESGTAWEDFVAASRRLDRIYNGIVFKKHDILDDPGLALDDGAFASICEELSHKNSPYDFNAIPIHILGSIYERFLGNVIVATEKRARVEPKPEVRKAGGVYYTPDYIVRYIVENTVGKMIAGRTPVQIAEMRFADIACGSGSFLLGVYDLLLRYHLQYFSDHPRKVRKGDCVTTDGVLHLSLEKKREILLNNIYGVDIDPQAVEVTQLSLYLKLLDEETIASARSYQLRIHAAILPPLNKNVACGNSLIEHDILDSHLFTSDAEKVLNPMNFHDAFPDVMKRGGFDAIVGNPPYILLQILQERFAFEYIGRKYDAAKYKIDTYHVFIERALRLCRLGGRLGYITPNTFLRNKHAKALRGVILEQSHVEVLRLFYYPVFAGVSVDASILILQRSASAGRQHQVNVILSRVPGEAIVVRSQPQRAWQEHPQKHFSIPGIAGSGELESKIRAKSHHLGEFATAYFGVQTLDRTKFVKSIRPASYYKAVIDGVHINRYALQRGSEFVDSRLQSIKSGGKKEVYERDRIGVRQIGETPIATFLPRGLYTLNTIYNIYFTRPTSYDLKFVLAIVSSKAIRWYWRRSFFDQKRTFPKIKKDALLSIPIPRIDFSKEEQRALHDALVLKVDSMLEATEQLGRAKRDRDKNYYAAKCVMLDRQIDAMVYELYGLTENEIRIVESLEQA